MTHELRDSGWCPIGGERPMGSPKKTKYRELVPPMPVKGVHLDPDLSKIPEESVQAASLLQDLA